MRPGDFVWIKRVLNPERTGLIDIEPTIVRIIESQLFSDASIHAVEHRDGKVETIWYFDHMLECVEPTAEMIDNWPTKKKVLDSVMKKAEKQKAKRKKKAI